MELNFKEFGQGDPIIILHGLFGTSDNWQTIAKQLAKEYTVFIVDQRNHGRSPHDEQFDYPTMAEDLLQFMEDHWIYETYMIGHSMGGKTAMEFAMNYPDMLKKLVVVDIAPKAYEGGHQSIFDALFALDLSTIKNRKDADDFLQTRIEDYGVRQFLLKNLSRTKEGSYHWKMNLPAIYANYDKILDNIKGDTPYEGPSLFIKGGKSNYINQSELPLIQKLFINAQLEEVEQAGHWVHAEAPKELLNLLQSFFKD